MRVTAGTAARAGARTRTRAAVDSLDAFVRARLAEDAMVAREAGPDIWQPGDRWPATRRGGPLGPARPRRRDPRGTARPPAVLAHVVRHYPERVLRDVEAKRAVHGAYRRAKPGSMNSGG